MKRRNEFDVFMDMMNIVQYTIFIFCFKSKSSKKDNSTIIMYNTQFSFFALKVKVVKKTIQPL